MGLHVYAMMLIQQLQVQTGLSLISEGLSSPYQVILQTAGKT